MLMDPGGLARFRSTEFRHCAAAAPCHSWIDYLISLHCVPCVSLRVSRAQELGRPMWGLAYAQSLVRMPRR